MAKSINKKNKKDNKYNAENEIIIGVTTKPKENVRVENKKATRTNTKVVQNKKNVVKNTNQKKSNNQINKNNKVKVQLNNSKINKSKNKEQKQRDTIYKREITKEEQIRKINAKKVIISVFILLFIALCGTIYYLTTPVFNIASIEVYGNEKNSVETYISLSKIDINSTNIFAITESRINKNIKENAYVEQVTIKRKLPNILQINVTERKVAYQIKYSDNYLYIDSQGHILEISEEKKDVPYIEGFSTFKESINVGQRLIEEDLIKLNVVAKFMNYCKYNSIENKITNIDVADDTNYIIYFKEDKKTLHIGDASNLSERLSMLKTILKNEKNKKIEIFMNGDLNKDDVYIRYIED